ncbi:MAG: AmmeMemoRadiSam system radical SAM enzyme [Candidatus Brocadiia bacterium]
MTERVEARFYRTGDENAVDCHLCSHRCHIAEGKRGFCRVRENRDGTLYTHTYGRLIAEHLDPIEKKPLYHVQPGTQSHSIATPGCNFRCSFCQNWRISQVDATPGFESIGYVEPEETVRKAVRQGAASIAYTYTEPTIFMEYALDCAELAQDQGLKNVFVTNGYQTPEAIDAMAGLIDAANVDLKAFTEEFYRHFCRAHLEPVLEAIRTMHEAGIHVEVTTLVVPGQNDDDEQLQGIAEFIADVSADMPWHISRFHPDYQETELTATPVETMERAQELGQEAGLNYIYLGNVLTPEGQNTRCPECGHLLVRRSGLGRPEVAISEPKCPECGHPVPFIFD